MVDWKVTAATLYCEAVDDEVTIIVNGDWSVKCTGQAKYGKPSKDTSSLVKKKAKTLGRQLKCAGLECAPVTGYKKKLVSEEPAK